MDQCPGIGRGQHGASRLAEDGSVADPSLSSMSAEFIKLWRCDANYWKYVAIFLAGCMSSVTWEVLPALVLDKKGIAGLLV